MRWTPEEKKLWKRMATRGGFARAKKLTPERRKEIAAKASQARWSKAVKAS